VDVEPTTTTNVPIPMACRSPSLTRVGMKTTGLYDDPTDLMVRPKVNSSSRLPNLIETREGMVKLLCYLAGEGSNFLDDSYGNNCLYFEDPLPDSVAKANTLVQLGPFSAERWRYVGAIHVLFPPLPSFGDMDIVQLYISATAYLPHYQETFQKFLDAWHEYDYPLKIYLYDPREDHSNHFMFVLNQSVTERLPLLPDWDAISIILDTELSKSKTSKKVSSGSGRQVDGNFVDYGLTGNQGNSRESVDGVNNGIACPPRKPGTKQPAVLQCFLAATEVAKNVSVEWLPPGEKIFLDKDNPLRQSMFARIIAEHNWVEALRIHKSSSSKKLLPHIDKENPMYGALAAVLGMNRVDGVTGERLGINAYMRKAVTDSLSRMAEHLPYLSHIGDFYGRLDPGRRTISPNVLLVVNDPNMDAYGYHAAFVNYIFLLTAKFNLCLPEIIGLVCAQDFMHGTQEPQTRK